MSLISLLSPGLPFPDNQTVYTQSKKCPVCRGRKWKVRPNKTGEGGIFCPRCSGTGRQHETGGQHQTRAKKIAELSSQDVLGYAQGLPDKKWQAFYWKWFRDPGSLRITQRNLMDYAETLAKEDDWRFQESARAPRIERLCLLACFEMESPRDYNTMEERAKVMDISRPTFERKWQGRYFDVAGEVQFWSSDAESYIYRQHFGEN